MHRFVALACVAGAVLVGCGRDPAPSAPPRPSATPQVIGIPGGDAPASPAGGDAATLLVGASRALAGLKGASYEGVMYCRGSFGSKPAPLPLDHGEWEATSVYEVKYQAPATYRIDVAHCTNPRSVGMAMLLTADHVDAKLPGLLGLLPIQMAYDDANALDFRGNRADFDSFTNQAHRFATPPADAHLAGTASLDGQVLDLVEIPHGPAFDRAIVREVVGIDRVTHLVRYHANYTAQRKVYEVRLKNLRPNVTFGPDELAL